MVEGAPIALTAADRAIVALETGAVVGHTVKLVELAGRVTAAQVADRIRTRLPATPRLATRLHGWPDDPHWVHDDTLDVADLVSDLDARPADLDASGLRQHVGELFTRRLDRSRPLWHVTVAPLDTGGTALIWRLHHALADGMTAVRLAEQLFWDTTADAVRAPAVDGTTIPPAPLPASPAGNGPPAAGHAVGRSWTPQRAEALLGAAVAAGRSLAGLLAREVPMAGPGSPFDVPVSASRVVGWSSVSIGTLKAGAAAVPGATVNDALLAAVAGGLRQWSHDHGRPLTDLHVRVPVSLHHPGESGGPGNADSFFTVTLPVHLADPRERLRVIHEATAVRKRAGDARHEDEMLRSLDRFDAALGHRVESWLADPRRFALAVSNLPGPRRPVTVLGHDVVALTTMAEIGQRHGLRIAAISCGDRLTIGFCADPAVVPDAQALAEATAHAAAELVG